MMFKDFLNSSLDRIGLKSKANYVEFGYGQVEPNHLSAQRTGQIYAQLPAKANIDILENGQFVKYDYAANGNGIGEVNFTGAGEWMLVYNEIKLYRDHPDGTKQWDCEFAMIKDNYQARIYSPYDYETPELEYHNGLYLNGKDEKGNTSMTVNRVFTLNADQKTVDINGERVFVVDGSGANTGKKVVKYKSIEYVVDDTGTTAPIPVTYAYDDVTKDVEDYYEIGFTNDPWQKLGIYREKKMPEGTSMVPRVFKTNIGDIMTTNMIAVALDEESGEPDLDTIKVGAILAPNSDGVLAVDNSQSMKWQVVKVYTMPDGQRGVKVMRIA